MTGDHWCSKETETPKCQVDSEGNDVLLLSEQALVESSCHLMSRDDVTVMTDDYFPVAGQ